MKTFVTVSFSFLVFFLIMIPQVLISKYVLGIYFNEGLVYGVMFISFYISSMIIIPKYFKQLK